MKKGLKILLGCLVMGALAGGVFFFKILPVNVGKKMNVVTAYAPYAVSETAKTFGVDHIALGSDFDGAVTTAFDTSELVALTDALLKQGMSAQSIAQIMGENQIAYFLKHLPE